MKVLFKKKGFTLIEIMVVLSIISLLASIIIGNISDSRKKASSAAASLEGKQVLNAAELARSGNNLPSQDTSTYLAKDVPALVGNLSQVPQLNSDISNIPDFYYVSDGSTSSDGNGIQYHCVNGLTQAPTTTDPPGSAAILVWIDETYENSLNEKRGFLVLSAASILAGGFNQAGTLYSKIDDEVELQYGSIGISVDWAWPPSGQKATPVSWFDSVGQKRPVACLAL